MIRTDCRICHSKDLKCYLDLGFTPLADAFLTKDQLDNPEVFYPLKVNLCMNCGHSQLTYVVEPQILYQRSYPYESSTTRTGREHYYGMAENLSTRLQLNKADFVIDVGSNVGVLLTGFKNNGTQVLGVDPATDMAQIANDNGIPTIPTFFSKKTIAEIQKVCQVAKIITGTNVFAHIDDLDDFMQAVTAILDKKGAFILEVPHSLKLIKNLEYDTIYHEHLSYVAVKPLQTLFNRFGFEVFDVEQYPIHGGTIRVFACRQGDYPVSVNVRKFIEAEEREGLYSFEKLREFASKVYEHKNLLISLLRKLKDEGNRVVGISAPAKGNTLLNYCHVDRDLVEYITEKAKIKIGLYTPGTLIPIIEDNQLLEDNPEYALLLAWNFAEEIMNNLSEYKERGGKFIIPVPTPRVV